YDLGGGTFDISILKVSSNDFDVLAVGGDSQLGGDDFDNAILEWAAHEFKKQYGIDLLDDSKREYAIARQRLKEEAEKAKIDLSESDYAEILIPELAGHSLDLELHIDQFNELINPFLQRTIDCMRQVLRETNLSADDIDRIVLVGGSTRIRAVQAMVSKEVREPYCDENADEAVAWGAAIVAASLGTPVEDLTPIAVREVTAHSLGVGMMEEEKYIFQPLISRNSKYPCEGGVLGFTCYQQQEKVEISVYRGERTLEENNDELGKLTVPVKQPSDSRIPVAAVFKLDENGMLYFKAVDIPIRNIEHSDVESFLLNAFENNCAIDIHKLEKLIGSKKIPKPEKITIDSALG
ncbi:MAG TPA: hypothetical protein ENK06_10645, partial [Gammaproteobacteria bacterium]|nr:hypothetical protein [Gammaproteobacteria bacterium]